MRGYRTALREAVAIFRIAAAQAMREESLQSRQSRFRCAV